MYQEGRIEPGSGYSSGPTGGRTTNTSTNRTPFGSAGTDMGSGMMGNPTMGGRMLSANPSGLMPGYGFMSEPIIVDETTPNLEKIQSFPVVQKNNNNHFHQDPITGQLYRMTDEFHQRIPEILQIGKTGKSIISTDLNFNRSEDRTPINNLKNEYSKISAEYYSNIEPFTTVGNVIANIIPEQVESFTKSVSPVDMTITSRPSSYTAFDKIDYTMNYPQYTSENVPFNQDILTTMTSDGLLLNNFISDNNTYSPIINKITSVQPQPSIISVTPVNDRPMNKITSVQPQPSIISVTPVNDRPMNKIV